MRQIKAIIDIFYMCKFVARRLSLVSRATSHERRATGFAEKGAIFNFFACFLVIFIIITLAIFLPVAKAQSVQLAIVQDDFSGGPVPESKASLTNWNKYDYADEGAAVTPQGDLTMGMLTGEFKDATSDDFQEGTRDSAITVSEDKITLSRPMGVREYTVGTLSDISVTISDVKDYGQFDVSLSGNPDLSRLFKNDKLTDAAGNAYQILSVSDPQNRLVVVDSENNGTAPVTGSATVGRWFADLSAWERAREGDLTAGGTNAIERAVLYYDGAADTSNLVIDGWVTDPTHYIEITVPASERHTGVWMPDAYTLTSSLKQASIVVRENYTKIHGLQIETKATDIHYNVILEASGIEFAGNILKGTGSQALQNWNVGLLIKGGSSAKVYNNILYGFTTANMRGRGIAGGGGNPSVTLYNNTVYGCDIGIDTGTGGVWLARNNISYNNTNNYHGTFDFQSSNNLSGPIEKSAPGSSAQNGVFVDFLDDAAHDFHLNILDSGAKDAGVDLSAEVARDIDGETRSGSWDLGADDAGVGAIIVHSIGAGGPASLRPDRAEAGRDFATLQAWETAREGDLTRRNIFKTTGQSGAFTEGETVTNGEGASGRYVKERDVPSNSERTMTLDNITGTFTTDDVLIGQTSGASARLQTAVAVTGVIEKGEVFRDTVFTGGVEIKGSTTDADHYMFLSAAPRHCHRGGAGTGAKIDMQKAEESAITISDDHTVVEWLEITNWGGGAAGIKVEGAADGVIIRHNIIHDNDSASSGGRDDPAGVELAGNVTDATVADNIIYNIANSRNSKGAGIKTGGASGVNVTDNIVYNVAGTGVDGGSAVARDNIAVGCGKDFSGSFTSAGNNISSDGSAPGAGSLTGKSVTDLDFISIEAGSEDLHTQNGSAARDLGLYLPVEYSANAANDAAALASSDAYDRRGEFLSRVYDTQANPVYKTVTPVANAPQGTSIELKLRSSADALMSSAADWAGCPALALNTSTNLSGLACLTDGARYIQYRAVLISDDGKDTPRLDEVAVVYEGYSKEPVALVSSAFDTGSRTSRIGALSWDEAAMKGVNQVKIQLRTAPDNRGAPGTWGQWLGPTGAGDYYEGVSPTAKINPLHQDGIDDQWIQYRVEMATSALAAPVFSGIRIVFGEDLADMGLPAEEKGGQEEVESSEGSLDETDAELTAAQKAAIDALLDNTPGPGEELYDVVIKLGDNKILDPLEDAAAMFKEGDVVVAKPVSEGHVWSENERRSFLIIQLYLTPEEAVALTEPETAYTGETDKKGNLLKEVRRNRARKIDLKELGVSKAGRQPRKVRGARERLKGRALKKDRLMKVKK